MILPKFHYHAHCYQYKFFYIGWIVRKAVNESLYSDPDPKIFAMNDSDVVYVCFGLTENSVMKKFRKYVNKYVVQ